MIATQRPGVYSEYIASGILWGNGVGNDIAIIAKNTQAKKNKIFEITKVSDAQLIFGDEGIMVKLCEIAFSNGATRIQAVATGEGGTQDYNNAFNTIKQKDGIRIVICDSNKESVNLLLKGTIIEASENLKERIAIVACQKDEAVNIAKKLNCERMILLVQEAQYGINDDKNSYFLSAALAGKMAQASSPITNYNGTSFIGITDLNELFTEEEIDYFLQNGIAVFETVAGCIEIIRAVTTRTTTDGLEDSTFHDINTVLIIDDVISSIRKILKQMISNAKNNETTRNAILTQATIELENKKSLGIIESYNQPKIYPSEKDPTVCIVEIQFVASHLLNQILITTYIKV